MSARGAMRTYLVIPTYRRSQLLERTLASIAEARLPESLASILVIENAERTGSEAVCERFADRLPIRYLFNTEAGRSRAIQTGLEQCDDGLAVIFDDDIRVAPECLVAYERAAMTHGPGNYFGGAVGIDFDQPPKPWLKEFLSSSQIGYDNVSEVPTQTDQLRFLGFNMALFVSDYFAVGGMNPNLGAGAFSAGEAGNPVGSEWEFQGRLHAQGVQAVFVPEAKVWHYVPPSRCSPEWVLYRRYRTSLMKGMLSNEPRKRVLRHCLRAPPVLLQYVLSYLIPQPRRRFKWRRKAYAWVGEVSGLVKRRRV